MKRLAEWIASGESGSVVGLSGCGRSNLLGFLCHQPKALQAYLGPRARPVALIPVDLNNLPAHNLATLYRVIARAFYRVRERFEPALQEKVAQLYEKNQLLHDPFLAQGVLQELLALFQNHQTQVVLVLNRFDEFCQFAEPRMLNTLRGLRDEFKDTLCYLAGMTQEAAYLPDPAALGHMYELLDSYVCWVGAMTAEDACLLISQATSVAPAPPSPADVAAMLALTGGYPALLRATCYWWLTTPQRPAQASWEAALLAERSVQYRLAKIWAGLTQEEQFILAELHKRRCAASSFDPALLDFYEQNRPILAGLARKGVCCPAEDGGWQITARLMAGYIAHLKGRSRGKIWLDESTGEIYQGESRLGELTGLERAVLTFLLKHPRVRHTKTDLIINTWPAELRSQGVTDNSLYQIIFALRQAIEPDPADPVYLLTWRGKPEGGYQFFSEGRPR
jgi:hypothetical protein